MRPSCDKRILLADMRCCGGALNVSHQKQFDMINPIGVFKEYCKKKEMRYTPEREVILAEIYRKDGHFDADDLFLRIRNRFPKLKVAKGSIYRTLPHLISAGLVRESYMKGSRSYYEHTLGHAHHDHMRCIDCGEVSEFHVKEAEEIQEAICEQRNFKLIRHIHILIGHCEKCRNK